MKRFSLAILLSIFGVIAIILVIAIKAMAIPMIAGYDEKLDIPSVSVTYSMEPTATFRVASALKVVHAGPGTVFPESGEDKQSFEENFNFMIVFGEKNIPKESRLYIVKPNPDSPEIHVQLSDGEHLYASGTGDTFAKAMDDLMTNFFVYDHMADEVPGPSAAIKKDIEI